MHKIIIGTIIGVATMIVFDRCSHTDENNNSEYCQKYGYVLAENNDAKEHYISRGYQVIDSITDNFGQSYQYRMNWRFCA